MNTATLEREILKHTKNIVCNGALKRREIVEWAFGEICPRNNEVVVPLHEMGCNVCIPKNKDRRKE